MIVGHRYSVIMFMVDSIFSDKLNCCCGGNIYICTTFVVCKGAHSINNSLQITFCRNINVTSTLLLLTTTHVMSDCRNSIKESSVQKLGSVCRRVYRIFSHAYFHHRPIFDEFEVSACVISAFIISFH